MLKQLTLIITFVLASLILVKADQIYIYSPPQNAQYHVKDIMDLRYKVRYIGMNKIWSAGTSLVHLESNTLVNNFTNLNWVNGESDNQTSIHDVWNIPGDIKNGTYAFIVTANTTFSCSENSDGKAPFTRCHSFVQQNVTFSIQNSSA